MFGVSQDEFKVVEKVLDAVANATGSWEDKAALLQKNISPNALSDLLEIAAWYDDDEGDEIETDEADNEDAIEVEAVTTDQF